MLSKKLVSFLGRSSTVPSQLISSEGTFSISPFMCFSALTSQPEPLKLLLSETWEVLLFSVKVSSSLSVSSSILSVLLFVQLLSLEQVST